MAEWFNAAVLKTVEGASPPRVRISASPPIVVKKAPVSGVFLFFNNIYIADGLGVNYFELIAQGEFFGG